MQRERIDDPEIPNVEPKSVSLDFDRTLVRYRRGVHVLLSSGDWDVVVPAWVNSVTPAFQDRFLPVTPDIGPLCLIRG